MYVYVYILVYYIFHSPSLCEDLVWSDPEDIAGWPSAPEEQDTSFGPLSLKRYAFLMVHVYRAP